MKSNKKLNRGLLALCLVISFFLIVSVSFAADDVEDIGQSEEPSIAEEPIDEVVAEDAGDDTSVQAGTLSEVYVNSDNGTSEGTGSADSPVKTIQEGINLAGNGGTVYMTGTFSGTGNSALTFPSQSINFVAVGDAVIDGKSSTKFATINSGTYTFTGISVINNYVTATGRVFGGAFSIGSSATVTFNMCLFENNGVLGTERGNGGAIDNEGTLNINNCTFIGNYANITDSASYRKNAADGGAISNLGKLTIRDSDFISNHALRNGGAIRAQDSGFLKIYNSRFEDNAAEFHLSGGTYGGAIYIWGIDLEVYNTTFMNNRITETKGNVGQGGAISVSRNSKNIIVGCDFINNTATGSNVVGPSIFIDSGVTTVNNCTIDTQAQFDITNTNLNYNWWSKNDISRMVVGATAKPTTYAVFSVDSTYLGNNVWEITGALTWNDGTTDGIEALNVANANLASETGTFSDENPTFENGIFKVNFTGESTTNEISAQLDQETIDLTFNIIDIQLDAPTIKYGEDQNITIAFSQEVNGNVTVTVNNKTYVVPVNNVDLTVFTIPDILEGGNYTVSVVLNAGDCFGDASTNLTVSKESEYDFTMVLSEVKFGEDLTVTITLPDDATGNVTVKVGNDTQVFSANATIIASFSNLNATTYPVTASYTGNGIYNPKELSDSVSVEKANSSISIDSEIVADYGKIAIPVTTTNATGVRVRVFSKSGLEILSTTFESDVIELDLAGGEYNLEVSTIVDDNHNPATADASLTVNKLESSMTIVMIDGFNVTGVLKDSEGNFIANAEINCLVGEENVTAITNENGEFTVTVTNNIVLSMTYEGNSNATGCDAVITIKNIKTTPKATMIEVPSTMTKTAVDYNAGEKGTMFYFYLKDADGKALANKGIKIGIFDKIYTVKTDSNGRGGLQINIANANYYTYALSFLGDDDYKASFSVCSLQIVKKPITITPAKTSYTFKASAKTKTITATLKSSNSYIPKGKQVTLAIAGKTFKATIGDKGQISFNVGSITAKGTYKVAIKYAGSNTYSAATSKTITVKIS